MQRYWQLYCIDRLGKNTCRLFCNCIWCWRIYLQNRMVLVVHTFVVLPCHSLEIKDKHTIIMHDFESSSKCFSSNEISSRIFGLKWDILIFQTNWFDLKSNYHHHAVFLDFRWLFHTILMHMVQLRFHAHFQFGWH